MIQIISSCDYSKEIKKRACEGSFFMCGCIKGASHKTMKNTRGEREGGRQPRPRKLPIDARGDI